MDVKLDQHFMQDRDILDMIVSVSNIRDKDNILEIGPGKGHLTKKILEENPKHLIAIEKDEDLEEELNQIINKNFKLIIGNGLDHLDKHKYNKLIANIPYAITEPLYKKILEEKIPLVVMLHGIDFYRNILERETRWKYFVTAFYNVKLIDEVLGNLFTPPTKVKSAIVKLELKEEFSNENLFYQNLFQRRDRNTKNAIIFSLVELGLTKKEAKEKLSELNLDKETLNKKLENISNGEFMKITQIL